MAKRLKTKNRLSKTARKITPILGINVDSTDRERALNQVRAWIKEGKPRMLRLVVTPNPEIVVRAQGDPELARILNSADLSVPDGIGLRVMGGVREIIPGRLLAEDLVSGTGKEKLKVFLLGGKAGVAKKAAGVLNAGFHPGPWLDERGEPIDAKQQKVEEEAVQAINDFKPDLLLVGFGPPKQEKWLDRNLSKLNVKVGMVVGGAFDYWAGIVPKPPKAISDAGLEWLWRLITQPWRLPRIFTAVVVFPLKVFLYRMRQ